MSKKLSQQKQRKLERPGLAEGETALYPHANTPHHFFWRTELSPERRNAINAWILTLTVEQRKMLDDLLHDHFLEVEWDGLTARD